MTVSGLPATWQETFESHPISRVKAFELELRSSTLRDKERLRLLVGNNYRDLLATAGHIVDLNDRTHHVESSLSQLSQECQAPDLQLTSTANSGFAVDTDARATTIARVQFAAALLRQTSKCAKTKSVSLGSKTLVLAKLMINHLNENQCSTNTLDYLNRRLKESRRHLLWVIDHLLTLPTTSLSQLVEAGVAYCLITSASAWEAVSHMHDIRSQRLATATHENDHKAALKDLIQRCHYIIATRDATKAIAGRRVTGMLATLQNRPILQDPDLQAIPTLHLDTLGSFLPLDIIQFTPYFKRSTPTPTQIDSLFREWVEKRTIMLVKQIDSVIELRSLTRVLNARSQIFDALLPSTFSSQLHFTLLPQVQRCFGQRIEALLTAQAYELSDIRWQPSGTLERYKSEHFWQSASSYGSKTVSEQRKLQTIRSLHLGLDKDARFALQKLQGWSNRVQRTQTELQRLKKQRWQDKIEENDEADDNSASSGADIVQSLAETIGLDEPVRFDRVFRDQITESSRSFVTGMASRAKSLVTEKDLDDRISDCIAVLRFNREARHALQSVMEQEVITRLDATTDELEHHLVRHTAITTLKQINDVPGRPPTETFTTDDLPSPQVVKLLQAACRCMLQSGGVDLWTNSATSLFKKELFQLVQDAETRPNFLRTSFDEHYLNAALGTSADEATSDDGVARKASLYWLRTKALFGVLGT